MDMNISMRDKKILLMFLGVGVFAAGYFFGYRPQMEEAQSIQASTEPLKTRLDDLLKLAADRDFYLKETEDINAKVSEYTSAFPADIRPEDGIVLSMNDVITSINGVKITNAADYQKYIQENPLTEKSVKITYSRDGQEYDITVTPKEYRTAESGFTYNMYSEKAKGLNVVKYGAVEVKYMVRTTILSLKELVSGKLGMKDLSGPVGIVDAIGTTYEESKSEGTMILWMNMLNLAVLLSANLGVMNLLPFPALDGGRLVFLVIEAIRRKPINRQVEGGIHFAGLMLLMALMVFVMYNDIVKLI